MDTVRSQRKTFPVVTAVVAIVVLVTVLALQHNQGTEARWYAATTLGERQLKTDALKVEAVDQVDGALAMLDGPAGETESVPANPAAWKLTNLATTGDMVVDLNYLTMDPIDTIRSSNDWMGWGRTTFELTVREDAGPKTCARQDGAYIPGKKQAGIKGESQTIGLAKNVFTVTLPPQGSAWVCVHLVDRKSYNFANEDSRIGFMWKYAGTGVGMTLGYSYRIPDHENLSATGLNWQGADSATSHVMAYIPWVGRADQHKPDPRKLCVAVGSLSYLWLAFSWPAGYVPSIFSGDSQWGEQILYRDPAKPTDPWQPLAGKTDHSSGEDRLFGGFEGSAQFGGPGLINRPDDTRIHRWNIAELGSVADPAVIPDWVGSKQMYQLDLRARLILTTDRKNGGNDKNAPPINWIDSPFAIRVYYPEHDKGEGKDLRCEPIELPADEMESSQLAAPFGGARIMTQEVVPTQ